MQPCHVQGCVYLYVSGRRCGSTLPLLLKGNVKDVVIIHQGCKLCLVCFFLQLAVLVGELLFVALGDLHRVYVESVERKFS